MSKSTSASDRYLFVLEGDRAQGNLGANIEYIQKLTGWTTARLLAQAYPNDPAGRKSMREKLSRVKKTRAKTWMHSGALANAWGIREEVLLHENLTLYTLDELHERFGLRFYRTAD